MNVLALELKKKLGDNLVEAHHVATANTKA